jgi:hypothetical protein
LLPIMITRRKALNQYSKRYGWFEFQKLIFQYFSENSINIFKLQSL